MNTFEQPKHGTISVLKLVPAAVLVFNWRGLNMEKGDTDSKTLLARYKILYFYVLRKWGNSGN